MQQESPISVRLHPFANILNIHLLTMLHKWTKSIWLAKTRCLETVEINNENILKISKNIR